MLRTTLHQMGAVKDAVERQARSSLSQLDTVMGQRRERETLARLGELVRERARNGELIELAEHAEIAAILDELAELEARAHLDAEPGGGDDGTVSAADWTPDRDPGRRGRQDLRVWRPSAADVSDPPDDLDHEPQRGPSPAATAGPEQTRGAAIPQVPGASKAQEPARTGAGARTEVAARSRSRRSHQRHDQAAGGIAFMEDGPGDEDDLGPYMHEDDVPGRD